jgi:hypothetical protein
MISWFVTSSDHQAAIAELAMAYVGDSSVSLSAAPSSELWQKQCSRVAAAACLTGMASVAWQAICCEFNAKQAFARIKYQNAVSSGRS